jgi:molybdopterin molybdotransferase
MIPLLQARTISISSLTALPVTEVPLLEAQRRFLARPVAVTRDLPALDNSAMDGFAVLASDTTGARRDRPATLKVVGTLFAGSPLADRDLRPGEAFRIYTGAPIPYGADAVVRQEAAGDEGQRVHVYAAAATGEHLRRRGEELRLGAPLFAIGTRLDPSVIGVLASMGLATAPTRARPRVAVLTLGDELVPLGQRAEPHQVYDSNGALLAALCTEAGGEVVSLQQAEDREHDIEDKLTRARQAEVDLIVSTGGASVGAKDRIKQVIKTMGGTIGFDGVAIKPGKPAGLAMLNKVPIAILPGNPGACSVAFDQLARPMLLKLQGVVEKRRTETVRLDTPRKKQPALAYLLAARREERNGELWAQVRPQGAGQIFQNVGAEGWVVLPPGKGEFAAGERVEMELFERSAFLPLPPPVASDEVTR